MLLQVPVFMLVGMTLRMMGFARWPGFWNEGALWFPDLTQVRHTCSRVLPGRSH